MSAAATPKIDIETLNGLLAKTDKKVNLGRLNDDLRQMVERHVATAEREGKAQHATTTMTYQDNKLQIDTKLVDLMTQLWRLDIYTTNSCEEDTPGYAWIEFSEEHDLRHFFMAVFPGKFEELKHDKLFQVALNGGTRPGNWRYDMWSYASECTDKKHDYHVCVRPSVYFPVGDLPDIVRRLTAFEIPVQKND